MAHRKKLKTTLETLEVAKSEIRKLIPNKVSFEEASKITGILWAQLIAVSLVRLGWDNNVEVAGKIGVSESCFRSWRDGDAEPEDENKKKLAKFWESEMKAKGKTK